ncbi:MAG: gliding motility-associated ABC transporter substrate-binding protein GldG [Paludibacteraceae bacterium]|nr:gliding motility-associated ABC transporter substrate-binding protein GldG [Paludibacteraceae bacterium]
MISAIRHRILIVALLLAASAQASLGRWDLTADKRYTLSPSAQELVCSVTEPVEVCVLLDEGTLNAGFERLRVATHDLLTEMQAAGAPIRDYAFCSAAESGLAPTVIHERQRNGQTVQTPVYPYAIVRYKGRTAPVTLLRQDRSLSGEENLNNSIENLEYAFAEVIYSICKDSTERIAFLEGHGEADERSVYDLSEALSRYFQVDRGVLGTDVTALMPYRALIIADPQQDFSETDKFILDQYIMHGGSILWIVNGVKFSEDMLTSGGLTPVIAEDYHLRDLLFRYGIRINPILVQDRQCMLIPVAVSAAGQPASTAANYQPVPWTYAPLLLTSEASPITRGVAPVSATLSSCLDIVGEEDGLSKTILLATSSATRLTPVPAEVNLSEWDIDASAFTHAYVPVAASIEGTFTSLYAHRMPPDEVQMPTDYFRTSGQSRQIVIACGSIARNEWYKGQPLPLGYDRYTQMQFGNRDMLVNSVLWLTDDGNLMQLRSRSVRLRLINDTHARQLLPYIQILSLCLPLLLLVCTGGIVWWIRKKKYTRR